MKEGWISLYRKFTEHEFWQEKRKFSKAEAWIDILLEVNHKENNVIIGNKLYDCKRGESLHSIKSWAKRWGWSRHKTRHFLNLLKIDAMIDFKVDTKTTHLIVINYDIYQSNGTQKGHKKDTKGTSKGHQRDTNNNDNNENNKNKYIEKIYSEFNNINITEEEYNKLLIKFGKENTYKWIEKLYFHIGSKGDKYKSHYLTILNWVRMEEERNLKNESESRYKPL